MFYDKKNVLDEVKKINDDIKKNNMSSYYFIYGIETYFIFNIEKSIKNTFYDPMGLNTKIYTDENFDYNEVIKHLNNMPLMNDKKLVIFKNVKYFKNKKEKLKTKKSTNDEKDATKNEFLDALEKSKDFNIVVFIYTESSEANNQNFSTNEYLKFVEKNGTVFNSTKLDLNALSKYVVSHFKKAGLEISKDNAIYLIKKVGTSIDSIFNEADKIISYKNGHDKKESDKNEKKEISRLDLDELVVESHEEKVFQLIDLINKNMKNEAYSVYGELLAKGISEYTILTLFAKNYERLLIVRDLTEKSKSVREMKELTGIAEWQIKNFCNFNKGISKETLKNKLELVTDIQFNNMIGNYNQDLLFEILINDSKDGKR